MSNCEYDGTYGIAIEPMIGDTVKCATSDYYSLRYCGKVIVTGVYRGVGASHLITVKDVPGGNVLCEAGSKYKASNFKLVERSVLLPATCEAAVDVKFIVVDKGMQIVATSDTEDNLEEVVGKLLLRNPFNEYRVFEYSKTGKAPEVVIKWTE